MAYQLETTSGSAFGINIEIMHPINWLDRILAKMPPGWSPDVIVGPSVRYRLFPDGLSWVVECEDRPGSPLDFTLNSELSALHFLEQRVEETVALCATQHLFVHAAVCVYKGQAIVLPGRSMSGKTSLVMALCRAGASYSSDEFAPVDKAGWVAPYPRPLSIRQNLTTLRSAAPSLDFDVAKESAPIRLFVFARFSAQCTSWRPKQLSRGETILQILANTVRAQSMEACWMKILGETTASATAIAGDRADAEETASDILNSLEGKDLEKNSEVDG